MISSATVEGFDKMSHFVKMSLPRFFNLLAKTPKHSNPPSVPPLNPQFLLNRSLSSWHKNSKSQNLFPSSTSNKENILGSLSNPHFSLYRSLHTNLKRTPSLVNGNNQNPEVFQAEEICKLFSKPNNGDIETLLNKASIQVSPRLVCEVLNKMSNAGFIALSFFRWAEKQNGFQHTTEIYNALIESLGKIKQFKLIWNLVNDMKKKQLLSKDTFALIARRYARGRKIKEAIDGFRSMEKFGLKLESSDYNRLIDILSKSRHVERAQEVFDKMKNRSFKPDIKSYTILLEGWGQEKNFLRLNEVYREMKDEGFEPDVVTYGIVINAYCKVGKYDDAIGVFHDMEEKKCKPSPHIFCTLVNGLGSAKRLTEALAFFEQSKASGFPLESPTYNALVGAYCWSQRMHDAYRIVDEMRECGVGPNSRTYDIILHHLIKSRKTKEAYEVLQKMSSGKGCEPTVSTYEIMVRMFCNEGRVDMAIKVWDRMKGQGILPGMHMFSTLISRLCHETKLDEACKYFEEMLDVGIRPPASMFSHLKQTLLDEGKKETVVALERKIDKLRRNPLVG